MIDERIINKILDVTSKVECICFNQQCDNNQIMNHEMPTISMISRARYALGILSGAIGEILSRDDCDYDAVRLLNEARLECRRDEQLACNLHRQHANTTYGKFARSCVN